jgi:transcriptional regulator with XRE-family HTH domain
MMTNLQITSKIRQIREMRGVCQDAVAAALQITTRAYSKLERGETQLTVERLFRIAEILDVSVKEVLGCEAQNIFNNNPHKQ